MILSTQTTAQHIEFKELMRKTDDFLNSDAKKQNDFYAKQGGNALERIVFDAMTHLSKATPFEGTIRLVSGSSFPDIVAKKYFGVEVKSTIKDHWTSTGSSILESTRDPDVKKIYLTFGKLGGQVEFRSRPYEDCLSDIVVTHYPRYKINMNLKEGESIFTKLKIPYDTLRLMDNPVEPVATHYAKKLKDGQRLWWNKNTDISETSAPFIVKIWSTLDSTETDQFRISAFALFPEITGTAHDKYNRFTLWLVTEHSVVNSHVRDHFSAGGTVTIATSNNTFHKMPAVFGRIHEFSKEIAKTLKDTEEHILKEYWCVNRINKNRIKQWIDLVISQQSKSDKLRILNLLNSIFSH